MSSTQFDEKMNQLVYDYRLVSGSGILDIRTALYLSDKYNIQLDLNENQEQVKLNSKTLDIAKLKVLNEILHRLEFGQNKGMFISNLHRGTKYLNELVATLNRHNTYKGTTDGIKNYATHEMHEVINDPKNATTTYKSIDVAIDAFNQPIKKIKNQITYNLDDGHSISSITVSGAVGKDDVGVAANGTKVLFTVLNYLNREFDTNEPITENELKTSHAFNLIHLNIPYITFDGEEKIWSKNIGPIADTILTSGVRKLYDNILLSPDYLLQYINNSNLRYEYLASGLTTEEFLKRTLVPNSGVSMWEMFIQQQLLYLYDRDSAQALGSFVSMATDNAKTLNLDKLNAIQDFFSMHIFLGMNGCPEDVIVQFFNSPVVTLLKDTVKKDIIKYNEVYKLSLNDFKTVASFITTNQTYTDEEVNILLNLLELVKLVWLCSLEITEASRILSINQGVKVEEEEIVKQVSNLNTAFTQAISRRGIDLSKHKGPLIPVSIASEIVKTGRGPISSINQLIETANTKIKNYNETHENKVGLNQSFDLNQFVKDAEYREVIKSIMDVMKFNINVFDVIDKAPHFKAMFKKYNELLQGYTSVSALLNFEIKKAPALYDKKLIYIKKADFENHDFDSDRILLTGNYSSRYTAGAKAAWNMVAFETFLKEVVSNYAFKYKSILTGDSGSQFSYNVNCNFKTENSIQEFMKFMSSVVFPELVNLYSENPFIQSLSINLVQASESKNIYFLPSDNLKVKQRKSATGAIEFNNIKNGFEAIKDIPLSVLLGNNIEFVNGEELTVGDVVFIYNTFIKSSNINGYGFDPILVQYGIYDLMTKYASFIRDIDSGKIQLEVPPYVLMGNLVKNQLKRRHGAKRIVYTSPLPDGEKSITWTEYDKKGVVTFQRFTMTMPYNKPVPAGTITADKFKGAILSNNLLITNIEENCSI